MKIRELLKDESKWIKHDYARDSNGIACSGNDEDAKRWCLIGAMQRCYPVLEWNYISLQIAKQIRLLYGDYDCTGISQWNDDERRTFSDIKQLVEALDI